MKEIKLGYELAGVSKILHDYLRETTEELGIAGSYRPFLFHLANIKDGVTQSELVEEIHFKAPTVSLTLQKMELDGLIRKENDPLDQRVTRIFLTDKGRLLNDKIKKVHNDLEDNLLSLYNNEEKKMFLDYLMRIKNKIIERNG